MDKDRIRLILIEDEIQIIKKVEGILSRSERFPFELVNATSLAEGIDCLAENKIDVILLDLMLFDARGIETLQKLSVKALDKPIVVLSDLNDNEVAIEAVRQGAQDFIFKSQMTDEHLLRSIQFAIERKITERKIKNSHKNYQSLAETANDIILAFDLDGVIRYTNNATQKTLGYTKEEMRRMNLADLVSQEHLNDIMEFLGNLISDKQPFALFEGEFITKLGIAIPIEANSTLVTDFDNQSGFVMIARDITQHKQALKAASEKTQQLRKIVEKNSDGIIILDTDSTILFANPAAGNFFGCDDSTLQGKYFDYETSTSEPVDIEILQTGGKKLIAEIRSVQTDWEGTPAYLCTMRDVTMRQRIENELKSRNLELKKAVEELRKTNKQILEKQAAVIKEERLRVLLQIADQTFYDINQPLKTIMGGIELLKGDETIAPSAAHHLSTMESACHQIGEVLKRIELLRGQKTDHSPNAVSCMLLEKDITILSVEDSEFSFKLLKGFLRHHKNIVLQHVKSLAEAHQTIDRTDFDLIFLDYSLPDGTGLDFLQSIKEKKRDIPVVFLTGKGNEMVASKALQIGAYEYLTKETISKKTILEAINKSLSKFTLQNELKTVQKKMADMSFRDEMTGLYNYRYFAESLRRELSEAKRYQNDMVLCMLDLDHFKRVNDTYGHPMGDSVLKSMGTLLMKLLRKSDLICRYGGEEFALILPHTDLETAYKVMERVRQSIANMVFTHVDETFGITVSIGLVQYGHDSELTADELIKMGDKALYAAKQAGRNKTVKCKDIASPVDPDGES